MASGTNTGIIQFAAPTADLPNLPTFLGAWSSMTVGDFLGHSGITIVDQNGDPVSAVQANADIQFPANTFTATIPAGELTVAGALRAVQGVFLGSVFMSLHSSDPGQTGANEITTQGIVRVQLPASGVTFSA